MRTVDGNTTLFVVAPVYNEVRILDEFVAEVRGALHRLPFSGRSEIVLVDDGSTDGSAEKLDALAEAHAGEITVLHLARNFGHAAAIRAGLDHADSDAVILMDADMQDDPVAFPAFLQKWIEGYDVVYARRSSRQESILVRLLFWLFYRVHRHVTDISIPLDAGVFALMDRRVVRELSGLTECNSYLPGLRTWIGFRQTGVAVSRRARYDNQTRVGMRGLWKLAMDAFFSFSYLPVSLLRLVGGSSVALSLGLSCWALYHKFISHQTLPTWASVFIAIVFFGGVNVFGIGLVGEYVARIYDEARARPKYIIDRAAPKAATAASVREADYESRFPTHLRIYPQADASTRTRDAA